jgi:hypothetical protein
MRIAVFIRGIAVFIRVSRLFGCFKIAAFLGYPDKAEQFHRWDSG